jgi:uncharacterized protein
VHARLPLDTFDGRAWPGITRSSSAVCAYMPRRPHPRCRASRRPTCAPTPGSAATGRLLPSLDADSPLAVTAARCVYRLPYFRPHMTIERAGDDVLYRSRRTSPQAALSVRYRPAGSVFQARPGTLEHLLTERYCAYTLDARARVLRIDIHHPRWPLQAAHADIKQNTMTAPHHIELPAEQPLLHYSARQDVVIWPPAPSTSPTDTRPASWWAFGVRVSVACPCARARWRSEAGRRSGMTPVIAGASSSVGAAAPSTSASRYHRPAPWRRR